MKSVCIYNNPISGQFKKLKLKLVWNDSKFVCEKFGISQKHSNPKFVRKNTEFAYVYKINIVAD